MNLKSASIYAIGSIVAAFLSFITLPILAWSFSQADVGRIVLLQIFCSLTVVVVSLGLDQAFVREYNETSSHPALAKTCIYPGFLLLTAIIIFASFFYKELTRFLFGEQNLLIFIVIILSLVVIYLERFFSVFIRMKELAVTYAFTRVAPKLLFLILIIWIYFSNIEKNFLLLSAVQMFCWAVVALIAAASMCKFLVSAMRSQVLKEKRRELFVFGLPLIVSGVAFWGLNSVDRIMLGHYSSLSEVGLYSVASGFAGAAILFQQIFSTIWHPLLYKWSATGDIDQKKFQQISEGTQLFSFLFISVAGLFSWILPYFLPESYMLAQYIFISCLTFPLFIMMSEVNGAGISIMRKTIYLPFITGLALIVNFFLNILLIPEYGASGAAAATAVSIFVFCALKLEISIYVWRSAPRSKFYIASSIILTSCVIYSLFGKSFFSFIMLFWCGAIPFLLILYKSSSLQFIHYILRR